MSFDFGEFNVVEHGDVVRFLMSTLLSHVYKWGLVMGRVSQEFKEQDKSIFELCQSRTIVDVFND